jgi:protein phosphatase
MITLWKKLLRKAEPAESALPPPATAVRATSPGHTAAFPPQFTVSAGFASDTGCRRQLNEDSWWYEHPQDESALASKGILAVVADGMGGHAAGDVASKMATTLVRLTYYGSRKQTHEALAESFHAANRAIYQAAQKQSRLHGMGTTCTALVICEGAAYSAQVGDSRLYLVRDDQLYLMSEDHSAVMEMVRRGRMSLEEARQHEDKNVILRSLGTQPEARVAMWKAAFPIRDQDHFILCSDGLYDLLSDDEIRETVTSSEPQAACDQLIALARERGGHDNITALVIRLRLKTETDENDDVELRPTREIEPVRPHHLNGRKKE